MRAVIYLVSGLFLSLGMACSPVIYEAPHGPYHGHGQSRHSSTVIVKAPANYGHPSHRHDRHRIEQELARRHHRAAAIYYGEGRPGDLIEITITGGYLHHQGRRIHYRPATFRLAVGDIMRFPSAEPGVDIYILYERGRLALDTDIFGGFHNTITRVDFRKKHHGRHNFSINNKYLKGGRGMIRQVPLNQELPRRYEDKKEPRQRHAVDHKLDHDKRRSQNAKNENSRKSRTTRLVDDRQQVKGAQPERRSDRHAERTERRSSERKSNAASGNVSRHQPEDRQKKNVGKKPRVDRGQEKTGTVFERVRKVKKNVDKKPVVDRSHEKTRTVLKKVHKVKKNVEKKPRVDRSQEKTRTVFERVRKVKKNGDKKSFTREDRRTAPVM